MKLEGDDLRTRYSKLADEAVARLEQVISGGSASVAPPSTAAGRDPRRGAPDVDPYHAAAAVLSSFDPLLLRPVPGEAGGDPPAALLADCDPVVGPDGANRWAMHTDVRRRTLDRIGSRERVAELLGANVAARVGDAAQVMFEAYVRGTARPIDLQEPREVSGTFEVSRWLAGISLGKELGVPDTERIRIRSDYLALLKPFVDLAATNFAGRRKELQRLRDHVGVLPPGNAVESISRVARAALGLHEKAPLVVHGPGGVGKSALIARFIWEHATLEADRFPYGYVDFDRPGARPEEPLTILIEAVRQLGLQYPDGKEQTDTIRSTWQRELVESSSGTNLPISKMAPTASDHDGWRSGPQDWPRYLADFARVLARLRVDDAPYLLVLDTFEEVQYRGDIVVAALTDFVRALQAAVPRARVVVAGRSAVRAPGFKADELELKDFDQAAAEAYLTYRGLEPPELVTSIVDRFGRSPLSLSLAAAAWDQDRELGNTGQLDDVATRTSLGRRLSDGQIQGQLYRRILEHVHNDDAKKLAYPGLVLRRLTPDIIRHVLAGPCGVDVPDDTAAQRLFAELAREVSLVSFEDGALVHRRDVRRIMLRLLRETRSDAVREIEEAAVAYYSRFDAPMERAEEIYHRLGLRQPFDEVGQRWMPGVERHLFVAVDEEELRPRERAWLAARLGRPLDPRDAATADLESWEFDTAVRVRELLARGQVARALEALAGRKERSPGSPLLVLEADAFERQERWTDARDVLRGAVDAAAESGDVGLAVDLLARCAAIDVRLGQYASAGRDLDEASRLLQRLEDPVAALRIALTRLAAVRLEASTGAPTDPLEEQARAAFDALDDTLLAADPALAAWAAYELGPAWPPVFGRVISLGGLEPSGRRDQRALARSLAEWDDNVAREQGRWPSRFATDLPYGDTLTQAWSRLLQDATPAALGARIAPLLSTYQPTPDILDTLGEILRLRAGGLATWEPTSKGDDVQPATGTGAGGGATAFADESAGFATVNLDLTPEQERGLVAALSDGFTRTELGELVAFRLGRTIDSISSSPDVATTAQAVVEVAKREGWLGSLAVAALASRPANAMLHAFAEPLGLTAAGLAAIELGKVLMKQGVWTDVATWRARLGPLEGQVCRIQVAAAGGTMTEGTGFLVGPDLVLTSEHVVGDLVASRVGPRGVSLAFDQRRLADGQPVNPGTTYRLSERRWLVDASSAPAEDPSGSAGEPVAGLDYVLLRVAGAPGSEPVGGDRAEPGAPPRGWIHLAANADPAAGDPLILFHHPMGGALAALIGQAVGLSADDTRLLYRTQTQPGSAGAPCFDARLGLVAMHQSRSADGVAVGLRLAILAARFERLGLLVSQDRRTV